MEPINVARLRKKLACSGQIRVFIAVVGYGDAPLTIEFAVEHAEKFDWDWAAEKLLSIEDYLDYVDAARILWLDYYTQERIEHSEYKIGLAKLFATIYLKDTK